MPSRLLSRGVRQDANESRNRNLDGEGMTQIQEISCRKRNEGAVGKILQASPRCLANTEQGRAWLFEEVAWRFEKSI